MPIMGQVKNAIARFTQLGSPVPWLTSNGYSAIPASEKAVAWADSQVGVREDGRNRGEDVVAYQEAAGLGTGGGFAWCAAFVTWCLLCAGAKRVRLPKNPAAVRNWVALADERGAIVISPARGRLFFWLHENGTGHIGFCLGGAVLGVFRTIEGNTDGEAGSREGDGVYKRTRTLRDLQKRHRCGFIDMGKLLK